MELYGKWCYIFEDRMILIQPQEQQLQSEEGGVESSEPRTLEMPDDEDQPLSIDPLVEENSKTLDDEMEEIMSLPGCSISPQADNLQHTVPTNSGQVGPAALADQARAVIRQQGNRNDDDVIDEDMEASGDEGQRPDDGDDEGFVEEDEEGWITPSNLRQIQQEMGCDTGEATAEDVSVACLTTDFAMQVWLEFSHCRSPPSLPPPHLYICITLAEYCMLCLSA